jgi:hypothetical protein
VSPPPAPKPDPLNETATRVAAIKKVLADFDAMEPGPRGPKGYFRGSARPWADDLRFMLNLTEKMDKETGAANKLMELAALKMGEYRQKIESVKGRLKEIRELVEDREDRESITHLIDSTLQEVAR